MWFKNLLLYRLSPSWKATAAFLEERLARSRLQRCGSFEMQSRGWISPRRDGVYVYTSSGQMMVELGTEQKLLPASVIADLARDRAAALESEQGYPVGRRQLRELKEQATAELLPKAFVRRHSTRLWLSPQAGWLIVDAAADAKGDDVLQVLNRCLDDVPAKRLRTKHAPASSMTQWLAGGEAPAGFTLDRDLELQAADQEKSTVRYVRHALEGSEIRQHIAAGKTATRLGLTWRDRVSFILTDTLQIKRVAFLGIGNDATDAEGTEAEEKFENDFTLMTGELLHLLKDLLEALGGEQAAEPS